MNCNITYCTRPARVALRTTAEFFGETYVNERTLCLACAAEIATATEDGGGTYEGRRIG